MKADTLTSISTTIGGGFFGGLLLLGYALRSSQANCCNSWITYRGISVFTKSTASVNGDKIEGTI